MARILIVDDEKSILDILTILLKGSGHEVVQASDGEEAVTILEDQSFDLLMTDMNMQGMNGVTLSRNVSESGRKMPIIMMTAFATVESASEVMEIGIFDYIRKPFKIDELQAVVNAALQSGGEGEGETTSVEPRGYSELAMGTIVAESEGMKRACILGDRVALIDATVLIRGERGTGKELLAHAIHYSGTRREEEFVSVDCAEVSPEEIPELLYGGEVAGRHIEGALERCGNGTIFIDHVENMDGAVQSDLLSIMKDKAFTLPGESSPREFTARVIAGAGPSMDMAVSGGTFNKDLHTRLSMIVMDVPAFRERREDIIPVAYRFLDQMDEEESTTIGIGIHAASCLRAHDWPRNGNELWEVMFASRDAAKEEGVIRVPHLPEHIASLVSEADMQGDDTRGQHLKAFLDKHEKPGE